MKADSPAPYPTLWAAWREILPALLRQARDPGHFVRPPLQPGAHPTPAIPGLIEIHQ